MINLNDCFDGVRPFECMSDGIESAISGASSPITIKDEGSDLTSSVLSIDFVGDGVSATTVGNNVTVSIEGGGAGGSSPWVSGSGTYSATRPTLVNPNTATGLYSTSQGIGCDATNIASHAEGQNTTASGQKSHAEGLFSVASANASHAEGLSTTAGGSATHAEGAGTKAMGNYSHSQGYYSYVYSRHSHVGGKNNDINATSHYSSIIGGQSNAITHSNAHIIGSNINSIGSNRTHVEDLVITNKINQGTIGTDASGNIVAGTSDERLKEDIQPLEGALGKVLQMRGVSFKYIEDMNMGSGKHFGLIAQELQSIIPELVNPRPSDEEHLNISYLELIGFLIESVKELQSQINELK